MTIRLLPFLLVLAFPARAEEPPWPKVFKGPPAKIIPLNTELPDAKAWQTARFRFLSDQPVNTAALRKFAGTIESVPQLLQALPLDLWAPADTQSKPAIILCKDEWAYLEAGGGEGSMGYYNGRKNEVIIRADVFLTPPLAKPSRLIPKPNEDLLVHELVHLGMHRILARSSPWFYEGIAEYMAAAHISGGYYKFHDIERSIRDHIRNYLPPDADGQILLPAPATLMTTTRKQWSEAVRKARDRDAFRPYATALLLAHYQLSSPERRALVTTYLTELTAYQDFRKPRPTLRTDAPDTVARRLQAFWKPRGLNLRFMD